MLYFSYHLYQINLLTKLQQALSSFLCVATYCLILAQGIWYGYSQQIHGNQTRRVDNHLTAKMLCSHLLINRSENGVALLGFRV